MISEEAFEAIMASDTPSAKRFRRWLFREVLPELRRTGRYGSPERKRAMLASVGIDERAFEEPMARTERQHRLANPSIDVGKPGEKAR